MEGALTQLSTHGHFITLSRYLIRLVLINALSLLNLKAHSCHFVMWYACVIELVSHKCYFVGPSCVRVQRLDVNLSDTDAILAVIQGNDNLQVPMRSRLIFYY